MLTGILLLIAIYLLYLLLIKGVLWKIILALFGWCGMYWYLFNHGGNEILMTISGYEFTWAQVVPTVIVLLAMGYTKD